MKWIDPNKKLPDTSEYYICELSSGITKDLCFQKKSGNWYHQDGRQVALTYIVKWLDESVPSVTSEDVVDLNFKKRDGSIYFVELYTAITPFGEYQVGKRRNNFYQYQLINDGDWHDCENIEHGIKLCNHHWKDAFLSQIKP